jgi:hypothetical protein
MTEITSKDKLREVRREIGYRSHVYARLVGQGKMTKDEAEKKIAVMTAIEVDYARIVQREEEAGRLI